MKGNRQIMTKVTKIHTNKSFFFFSAKSEKANSFNTCSGQHLQLLLLQCCELVLD